MEENQFGCCVFFSVSRAYGVRTKDLSISHSSIIAFDLLGDTLSSIDFLFASKLGHKAN